MNITPIIEALIGLATAVITCVLIPLVKSRTSAEQRGELMNWVKIAVSAAEQIYTGTGHGKEKKEWVLNWLTARGFEVDEGIIDALIESAVYALKNGDIIV